MIDNTESDSSSKIINFPNRTGGTTVEGGDLNVPSVQDEVETKGSFDSPFIKDYYKRKKAIITFLGWFITIATSIFLAAFIPMFSYYISQIREPLIRLDENYKNLESEVNNHTNLINDLQKDFYKVVAKQENSFSDIKNK